MRQMLLFLTMLFAFSITVSAQSDYYIKKAQSYQREAEYYQKKLTDIAVRQPIT